MKISFSVAQSSSAKVEITVRLAERSLQGQRAKSEREINELLRAAERVLARRGFAGLRVDDVLAEAGLSTRAFYRHFRGRSELFLALFDQESARAMERLSTEVGAHTDPEDRVRAWVDANLALGFDARVARRTRLFMLERVAMAREFRDEVRRCVRSVLAPLEQAIADGRDAGMFPHADPARDALAIHHLCSGLLQDALLGLGELNRAEAIALATRFAIGTLRSAADASARTPTRRRATASKGHT
ncbi:MAG: TetR/AcrR family transcriptional regulator [Actinobacteria bacterium]|nr:TetR/AcrR family transcriptional regulator [Actinomycetota bacterium]